LRKSELRRYLKAASETALAAGKLLKQNSGRLIRVMHKGRIDLVTEMDLRSEKLIVSRLRQSFPDFSFLTEESKAIDNDSDFRWIIDPLDGTTNYAHGFPVWCVSIALEYREQIVAGVVYDPNQDEIFTATLNEPARLNGKRIQVSDRDDLSESLLATGFPYDIRTSRDNNLDYFTRFATRCQAIRRAGSAALDLCYLAAGRFDGFWELKLHPWDTAAGTLIAVQAGARVSGFAGEEYSILDKDLLVSNGRIHEQMMKVLARRGR
jgi:myo-inositol-1(or 4)-monophosphatase